jgi:hypothetical protein
MPAGETYAIDARRLPLRSRERNEPPFDESLVSYVTSGGKGDIARLSQGIWTGYYGTGVEIVYVTWGGELWKAGVLPDGVTFRHTNLSTGEVRISSMLNVASRKRRELVREREPA